MSSLTRTDTGLDSLELSDYSNSSFAAMQAPVSVCARGSNLHTLRSLQMQPFRVFRRAAGRRALFRASEYSLQPSSTISASS